MQFTEERLFEALFEAARRIDADLATRAQQLKVTFEAEAGQKLLVDYARLFLGPAGLLATPYESTWLAKHGESIGNTTQALLDLFADGL